MTALSKVALKSQAEVGVADLFMVRLLLGEDGKKRILPAEIAEHLGVDARAAKQRAQRAFPGGWCMMHYPSTSGMQEGVALDLKYLPAFVLGFDRNRVRAEVRPRLEEIQDEMYDALAAYTFDGVALNPRIEAVAAAPAPPTIAGTARDGALAAVATLVADALAARRPEEAGVILNAYLRIHYPPPPPPPPPPPLPYKRLVGRREMRRRERQVANERACIEQREEIRAARAKAEARGAHGPLRCIARRCWRAAERDPDMPAPERSTFRYLLSRSFQRVGWVRVLRPRRRAAEDKGFASRLAWLVKHGWLIRISRGPGSRPLKSRHLKFWLTIPAPHPASPVRRAVARKSRAIVRKGRAS
jgi:hypothetical protein